MTRYLPMPVALFAACALMVSAAQAQGLASFAVLAGSAVTNTNPSVITGNVGVSPGGSITGFPPGIVNAPYTIHDNDAVAAAAQSELTTAYNVLSGQQATANLTGQDLGGKTLVGGVYSFNSSAQLTGTLTLDGQGKPNSVFVFNIGSTLTTAALSKVLLIDGANANNVFFRVGSSATLLAGTAFRGKIIALTSITLVNGASINCGAALARNGKVTLDNNVIGICQMAPLTITDGLDDTATETGTDVGNAIDDYIARTGTLPIGFQVLATLGPAELAAALAQLSGETATGASFTAGQAMDALLDTVNQRYGPGVVRQQEEAPEQNTVSVMGYAAAAADPAGSAFAGFGRSPAMPGIDRWTVWAGPYGGYDISHGDAALGTTDRTSASYGLAFGVERTVGPDAMFGFALSGGGTNFDLSNSLGSGHSAMLQAAAYARADSEHAYVSGAAAYGIHAMHTDRYVTFAGLDHFVAGFVTQDVGGQIEAGYHAGWFTPYAALRGQYYGSPAYSETTASGASTYALSYGAKTILSGRIEVGARADWQTPTENAVLGLHARAAWAHAFSTDPSLQASFQALPGSSFSVAGAAASADAILLSLGADMQFDSGLSLAASVDGGFTQSSQSYAGRARIGYHW